MSADDRREIGRLVDGLAKAPDEAEGMAYGAELAKIALCDLNRIADALERLADAR